MKCADCGAEIPLGKTVCDYCGSAAAPLPSTAAHSTHAETFARIKQSPEFLGQNLSRALAALPRMNPLATAIPVVFLIIFIAIAGFIGISAISMGAPSIFAIVPLGFIAIGILMLVGVVKQAGLRASAPALARPAIVTSKRTSVSGGGQNSSAQTTYYATFEFEDGERTEFTVDSDLYGQLSETDAGLLFTRADWAVKFQRV